MDEAAEYLVAHSREAAARLVERMLDSAASLTEHSERGRIVPELGESGVRELQVRPYRLMYAVVENLVVILAVLHQRRDFELWNRAGPER